LNTEVKIEHITKIFNKYKAVNDANIDIHSGEFFTLLGPSGCGKTTLLRTIAGFYIQDEGEIFVNGENIANIPAHKRNIGMVFQNYAIFPHMTVGENVAYGLKARNIKGEELRKRVAEALDMVELGDLIDRQPANMSGGQQQRVALARAIVIRPGILLMDEPLSNLDAKLRLKMRNDIKELQKKLGITTIYVTHDQQEALSVSDRIAVINKGVIQQIGTPREIYMKPANKFVANFIGTTNFIEGNIENKEGKTVLSLPGGNMEVQLHKNYTGEINYSIRPEGIIITEEDGEDVIWGKVKNSIFLGDCIIYFVELANKQIVEVHKYYFDYDHLYSDDTEIKLKVAQDRAIIFDKDGLEVIS
jgi:iron(III) transport system ATP-binding protein